MSDEKEKVNLCVILDAVGRTILGENLTRMGDSDGQFKLKNPVILHVKSDEKTSQMSIQMIPIFFREFFADKTSDIVFSYNKSNVTLTDVVDLDFRLKGQYLQMFKKDNAFVQPEKQKPEAKTEPEKNIVINLFDGED